MKRGEEGEALAAANPQPSPAAANAAPVLLARAVRAALEVGEGRPKRNSRSSAFNSGIRCRPMAPSGGAAAGGNARRRRS